MKHHPHLEALHPFLNRAVRVPPADVRPVPAAVWCTLKAVGVLKHRYILFQHDAYLVAVAVPTLAATLYSRKMVLHIGGGVGIQIADRYGCPGYFGIRC